jgi:hypothetical protein
MKLTTLATTVLIAISLTACGSEPAKPVEAPKVEAPKVEAPKQEAAPVAEPAKAAPAATTAAKDEGPGQGEMKEVCHDKTGKDGKPVIGKDGKPVQECKMIKVRKKLEGTEIPPAKK